MELLIVAVLGLLGIAAATAIGPKLGFSAPLLLVIVGILVSFLPFVPDIEIDPEWIIAGVLPPLLYSASVSMPSMEFRREFGAISGLSIALVVVSSVALGLLFTWIVPGLEPRRGHRARGDREPDRRRRDVDREARGRHAAHRHGARGGEPAERRDGAGAAALGDRRDGRDGQASGRSSATSPSRSRWPSSSATWSARRNLWVRSRVTDATVNTVISFTVPFLASVPSEALGASGLVAAVVAGLVTGRGAIRSLSPQHRASDVQNWRTIELILEGAVFLVMGLELSTILDDLTNETRGIELGARVAGITLLAVLVVRALFVFPMLGLQRRSYRRGASMKPQLTAFQERLDNADPGEPITPERQGGPGKGRPGRALSAESLRRFQTRIRRKVADIDYFMSEPLGWREGTVIVWAGMRGAITLAAAQTLPQGTPDRSLVIFVAFLVAAGSLIIQGGTLPWIVRLVKPAGIDHEAAMTERTELLGMLRGVADDLVREQREARAADGGSSARRSGCRRRSRAVPRASPARSSRPSARRCWRRATTARSAPRC